MHTSVFWFFSFSLKCTVPVTDYRCIQELMLMIHHLVGKCWWLWSPYKWVSAWPSLLADAECVGCSMAGASVLHVCVQCTLTCSCKFLLIILMRVWVAFLRSTAESFHTKEHRPGATSLDFSSGTECVWVWLHGVINMQIHALAKLDWATVLWGVAYACPCWKYILTQPAQIRATCPWQHFFQELRHTMASNILAFLPYLWQAIFPAVLQRSLWQSMARRIQSNFLALLFFCCCCFYSAKSELVSEFNTHTYLSRTICCSGKKS